MCYHLFVAAGIGHIRSGSGPSSTYLSLSSLPHLPSQPSLQPSHGGHAQAAEQEQGVKGMVWLSLEPGPDLVQGQGMGQGLGQQQVLLKGTAASSGDGAARRDGPKQPSKLWPYTRADASPTATLTSPTATTTATTATKPARTPKARAASSSSAGGARGPQSAGGSVGEIRRSEDMAGCSGFAASRSVSYLPPPSPAQGPSLLQSPSAGLPGSLSGNVRQRSGSGSIPLGSHLQGIASRATIWQMGMGQGGMGQPGPESWSFTAPRAVLCRPSILKRSQNPSAGGRMGACNAWVRL